MCIIWWNDLILLLLAIGFQKLCMDVCLNHRCLLLCWCDDIHLHYMIKRDIIIMYVVSLWIITALSFKATSSSLKGKRICCTFPFSFKHESLINLSKNQYSGCWVDNCNPEHITCSPHPSNQYIMWHASNSSRGMHMPCMHVWLELWTEQSDISVPPLNNLDFNKRKQYNRV